MQPLDVREAVLPPKACLQPHERRRKLLHELGVERADGAESGVRVCGVGVLSCGGELLVLWIA